jgi:hypothetical protein
MSQSVAQSLKAAARETGTGSFCPRHSYPRAARIPGLPANKDWMSMR